MDMIWSGSSERYGSTFLQRHHIHIAVFPPMEADERIQKVTLKDGQGAVNFYLLPYTNAGMLRSLAGEEKLDSADDAVRFLLGREEIDWSERNVLVSHQFYLHNGKEPEQCDSESPRLYVGGLDAVNTATVEQFDYVALGHIHSPQNLGSPLEPYRKLCCFRGTLEEIVSMAGEAGGGHDYVSITLTDEEPQDAPKDYLERYFDHILEVRIDNLRSKKMFAEEIQDMQEMTPCEAFEAFFADTTGRGMSEKEKTVLIDILEELLDGESKNL